MVQVFCSSYRRLLHVPCGRRMSSEQPHGNRIELFRRHVIVMPVIELSSSELRQRVTEGRSIRFRTPRAVEALIEAEKLYQPAE